MLIIENGKEIYKFKANNGNVNFPSQFCLGSISNEFDSSDLKEVFDLKEEMYLIFHLIIILLINLKF